MSPTTPTSPARGSPPESGEPDPAETFVFRFHDGRAWRCADPCRVERLLARALKGEPLSAVIARARTDVDALALPAMETILSAVAAAFGLPAVDERGDGFTEKTQVRVLTEYLRFKDSLKKNTAHPGSSPAVTAPPPYPSPPTSASRSGS